MSKTTKGTTEKSKRKIEKGKSLAELRPDLAAQWDCEKNGEKRPEDYTCGSGERVWWKLLYDDPERGHFDFEWKTSIHNRVNGRGCPYLSNKAVWFTYNDLETHRPDLAKEFDIEKNGGLTPRDIVFGSHKKVWWKCEKGHSWRAAVYSRSCNNKGCQHCAKELQTSFPEQVVYYYVKKLFEDAYNGERETIGLELDIYIPSIKVAIEYDGKMWHQDIEKDLAKNRKCKENGIRIIRIREVGCPKMLSNDFCTVLEVKYGNEKSLIDVINKLTAILGKKIDVDINRDMEEIQSLIDYVLKKDSLAELYPEIAQQFHPTRNGNLKPENVKAKSGKRVWWLLPYNDPCSGNHFDFEWIASIDDRTMNHKGCPFLSNRKVWPKFNDLLTLNKSLASEWNYEKNKELRNKKGEDISTPDKVTPGSHQKVWWKCSSCGNEWENTIERRNNGVGCPECRKKNKKQGKTTTVKPRKIA